MRAGTPGRSCRSERQVHLPLCLFAAVATLHHGDAEKRKEENDNKLFEGGG